MRNEPTTSNPWAERGFPSAGSHDRTWAAVSHIGPVAGYFLLFGHILLPLLILIIQGGRSPFIRENARRALNFQISVSLYAVGGSVLLGVGKLIRPVFLLARGNALLASGDDMPGFILHQAGLTAGFLALAFFLAGAFLLFNLVCVITAAARAGEGETFRYPFAIPFVR